MGYLLRALLTLPARREIVEETDLLHGGTDKYNRCMATVAKNKANARAKEKTPERKGTGDPGGERQSSAGRQSSAENQSSLEKK